MDTFGPKLKITYTGKEAHVKSIAEISTELGHQTAYKVKRPMGDMKC